ncbi:MAG: PilZ domain-containing protein [Candidatus Eisenbacteria bacterium]|uniref:PilZ domain-containing protein n=1 Tax=Eiseniibacteriota bacterium TaxID=2212470 RepID=A0A538SQA8_UNCEI|nr:MAG: PilZ domain-containing protein [Candidatus Eisenbacteria bacterium]
MPQSKRTRRGPERRNRPRAEARLSMRVEETTEGHGTQIVTESQNISSSGVYCTSSHYLAPFSKVALTIVLPRSGPRATNELVKCEGIVVRCQPAARRRERHYDLACMFSDLDDRRRALLEEFVAWRNVQALRAATGNAEDRRRATARSGVRRTTTRATPRGRTKAARGRSKTAARRLAN